MSAWFSFRSRSTLRAFYTLLAPVYAPLTTPLSSRARATALRWLAVADGESVLEVGTGPGRAFRSLLAANPSGWTEGIDHTSAMLVRARRRAASAAHDAYRLRHGTATALPYPDNRFDALFSAYVLDLLPSRPLVSALAELHRVLRPEGRMVIVTLAPPHRWPGRIWTTLARLFPPLLGGSRPINLRPLLRRTGFQVRRRTVRTQAGLPSAIILATPEPTSSN